MFRTPKNVSMKSFIPPLFIHVSLFHTPFNFGKSYKRFRTPSILGKIPEKFHDSNSEKRVLYQGEVQVLVVDE